LPLSAFERLAHPNRSIRCFAEAAHYEYAYEFSLVFGASVRVLYGLRCLSSFLGCFGDRFAVADRGTA